MSWATAHASLLTLALIWLSPAAWAADPPTAEALFRAGREASERGDHTVACQRFAESFRLDAAPGTLLNLAACQEALHRLAEAWESYQHLADSLAPSDDRLPVVKERLAALEVRLPRLTLQAESKGPPVTVLRDGAQLSSAALGVPLPMDPGEHRIVVRAALRQTREYVVILDEGERLKLRFTAGDPLTTEPTGGRGSSVPHDRLAAHSDATSGSARQLRTAGYVAGGMGVAGFVAMGVLSGLAFREKANADEHCVHQLCDDEGFKAAERGDRFLRLADVGLAVGVAGVMAGGVLIWQASRAELRVHNTAGGAGLTFARAFP